MNVTSWLKYEHEIKTMITCVNVMPINVNNKEKKILILIYVIFMLIYVNITDRQTSISKV